MVVKILLTSLLLFILSYKSAKSFMPLYREPTGWQTVTLLVFILSFFSTLSALFWLIWTLNV